jgi:hypothetical protein
MEQIASADFKEIDLRDVRDPSGEPRLRLVVRDGAKYFTVELGAEGVQRLEEACTAWLRSYGEGTE